MLCLLACLRSYYIALVPPFTPKYKITSSSSGLCLLLLARFLCRPWVIEAARVLIVECCPPTRRTTCIRTQRGVLIHSDNSIANGIIRLPLISSAPLLLLSAGEFYAFGKPFTACFNSTPLSFVCLFHLFFSLYFVLY